ncbi:MAG: hypothetical protein CTY34_03885 [Methylobacter sp.]|nr:MAG: hypothetical protein CTY34_03885 [Methylobacter sp.]PPD23795.1 MAG: hypothetical protein CTY24_03200 [Methylobacter sp.]PPD34405.1 MAG: hypothetical protein CTY18_08400 [Methylomonas sp.]
MNFTHPNAVLMVFCKAPVPGQVKTRLIGELTPEQAAQVHIELTTRTLQLACDSALCPVELWCAPSVQHDFFTGAAARYNVSLYPQQGAGLGERLQHAFSSALSRYDHALALGCDCPSLTAHDLTSALQGLAERNDCVLAPAEDGGYVLIGLSRTHQELFSDIAWGTGIVLEQTRAAIKRLGLTCHELATQWDLDTPKELARYRALSVI